MNFDKVIQQRTSIRTFTDQPVDKQTIETIIESARLAPSAVNRQPWKFFICESDRSKSAVRESYPREWFNSAPLYIVACGNRDESWKRPSDGKDHLDIDIAIAVEHMVLKVTDLGLATCWVCNFNPSILKEKLSLKENMEPVVILPIGYSHERNAKTHERNKKTHVENRNTHEKNRKSHDEITHWI